jgi:hypothetical protein
MVADQAAGLAAVLAEPDSGGYAVTTAIDPPLSDLRAAFEDSLRTSRTGDTLILYYSGHGLVSDSAELFLTGTDANPENLQRTAYPAEELGALLDASAASTVVVLLDCCYVGRMIRPGLALAAAAGSDAHASGDPYRRRSLITSSTDLELAHYDNTGSSFTSALMKGLEGGADLNRDGVVDIEELYLFVSSRLRGSGVPQLPAFITQGGGGAPAVVRTPGMRVGGLVVPSLFVQAAGGASAARRLLGLPDGAALDGEPDPAMVRRLEDLTRVIDAAAEVWDETVIVTWLRSNNDHLGGARPIDALAVSGPDPVLAALDAEAEGVFA